MTGSTVFDLNYFTSFPASCNSDAQCGAGEMCMESVCKP